MLLAQRLLRKRMAYRPPPPGEQSKIWKLVEEIRERQLSGELHAPDAAFLIWSLNNGEHPLRKPPQNPLPTFETLQKMSADQARRLMHVFIDYRRRNVTLLHDHSKPRTWKAADAKTKFF